MQSANNVPRRYQELVFDPDHHPESSHFLEKVREEVGVCKACKLYVFGENDLKRLPCGHVFHYECVLDWFNELGQNRCPDCDLEFQLIRPPRFDEDLPIASRSGGAITLAAGGLSCSEQVAGLRWTEDTELNA